MTKFHSGFYRPTRARSAPYAAVLTSLQRLFSQYFLLCERPGAVVVMGQGIAARRTPPRPCPGSRATHATPRNKHKPSVQPKLRQMATLKNHNKVARLGSPADANARHSGHIMLGHRDGHYQPRHATAMQAMHGMRHAVRARCVCVHMGVPSSSPAAAHI